MCNQYYRISFLQKKRQLNVDKPIEDVLFGYPGEFARTWNVIR